MVVVGVGGREVTDGCGMSGKRAVTTHSNILFWNTVCVSNSRSFGKVCRIRDVLGESGQRKATYPKWCTLRPPQMAPMDPLPRPPQRAASEVSLLLHRPCKTQICATGSETGSIPHTLPSWHASAPPCVVLCPPFGGWASFARARAKCEDVRAPLSVHCFIVDSSRCL
jgi:hypothetical protein